MNHPSGNQSEITAVDFNPFADGELLLTAPATESQREIWASVQMGSDANCAYNESQKLWLRGLLNVGALRSALQELVLRHEALRTTFSPDGISLCIVATLKLEIPEIDLSGLDLTEREHTLANILKQAVEEPFDLEHGPLLRLQLIKTQAEEHLLLLTDHHIICDGWSWAVLMTDLGKLYTALKNGETPDFDEPEHFSEYAIAQQESKGNEEEIATEAYWLAQFANSIPQVDFPTDRSRPSMRTFQADREDWDLSPQLVSNLKQLGAKFGCSFMTTLLSAFEVWLYRLTGQKDLVVGVSAAGQAVTGLYNLVGHCVNLLPLRSHLDSEISFSDYLQTRRSEILDAYDYQQFTFGSLVQKLSIPRDASRIPLVPILLNIDQGLDSSKLSFEGLEVELFSNPRTYENFELFVNATELAGKVTLECQYNTNLFDAATISLRMAELETLLEGIVAAPNQSISILPLLPVSEQQLLAKWNNPQVNYPSDKTIHQIFEEQVAKTPEVIAVSDTTHSLTYQELNQRANQLAWYLQHLGVKPESFVGICVERSLEMVIGILGILKAGGVYVPIDPSNPKDRLEYILSDAKVQVLVTQSSLLDVLPSCEQVVSLDSDSQAIEQYPQSNPTGSVESNNLAYIIYTSGSTGKPKGVLVSHYNVIRLFTATESWYNFNEKDVWSLFHSFAFDFSVWEIWGALFYGGRIVIVPHFVSRDTEAFYKLLISEKVTVLNQTPAAFYQLIEVDKSSNSIDDLSLRLVIFGGEALNLAKLQPWFERHSDRSPQMVNMYGITETTVHVTYRPIILEDVKAKGSLIGCPIPDLQIFLLDQYRQLVPIGVCGEIYVGGAGVAQGYWQRDDMTQERFISNHFSSDPNSRLYKSGDLARYLPDGSLEYLGRIDNQIKIRGFRIELGEIEAVLSQYPTIQKSVVILREDIPADKRIVAYFEPIIGQEPDINALRSFFKQKLPDYMIPNAFVSLKSLPLSPNGKIDRKKLPAPDGTHLNLQSSYVPPRNLTEQQVADVWLQVLNIEKIGIHDNFFELGGHSLLATQIIARLRKIFTVELSLRTFFEASTIADLSERVTTLMWARQSAQVANINIAQDNLSDQYEEGEL